MVKIEKYTKVFSLYPQRKMDFGATNLNEIFTWVDALYEIHYDTRSQKGDEMSMGLGVTHFRFSKQKLKTKIST